MATIVTKNSSTASAVPTTSDLVQGELAVNVTDKRIFTENASTQIVELGTNPSTITTGSATVTGTLTANGTFASNNAVITGGSINSTPIGATTPSTVRGSTVTATTGFVGGLTGNVTGNLTGNVTGNVVGNLTGNVTGNVTASTGTTTLNNLVVNGTADFTNTKLTNITTPTLDSDAANKGYVDATVAAVIDSAPAALDTLNELAAALGDDANFSATVTTALATKLPLAGGTMSGAIAMGTSKITGLGDPTASQDAATKTYVDTADNLKLNLSGGTMSGAIAMGTNKITGLGDPTLAQDAATKAYTDSILGSATSAAASAAAAATSESNAATSASNAATSETNALNSANAAASSYDQFDDRYLGDKASDPTLDNDGNALLTGALYFNTTTDVMRVYTGSAWQDVAISTNSPTFTGTVTADGLSLGDNEKATFGAGNDLEIYHNGYNSYIDDTGTGSLIIRASTSTLFQGKTAGENQLILAENGAVTAYYDNAQKLATTATGIVVTGTATMDGLDVSTGSGDATIFLQNYGSARGMKITKNYDDFVANFFFSNHPTATAGILYFKGSQNSTQLSINGTGDISFYEDTGTTPKFFWDASAESLGIGTSSPVAKLHLKENDPVVRFEDDEGGAARTYEAGSVGGNFVIKNISQANQPFTIRDSGRVGIGISSPSQALDVVGAISFSDRLLPSVSSVATSASAPKICIGYDYDTGFFQDISNNIGISTAGTERMRIDSSGNVGIGATSPSAKMHIQGTSTSGTVTNISNFSGLRIDGNQSNASVTGITYQDGGGGGAAIGLARGVSYDTDIRFYTNPSSTNTAGAMTERLRIDSSGNLLVGTTDTNPTTGTSEGIVLDAGGVIFASNTSDAAIALNRTSSDGNIAIFKKDGTTVGSIGSRTGVVSYFVLDPRSGGAGITAAGSKLQPTGPDGQPIDNTIDLGEVTFRFDDIYATNGTIQTSDRNEKQDIEVLSDAEQRVAVACKGLLRKFRWKSAVEEKGDDARIHFGIIAQDLQAAFEAEGLDAGRYAMFIHSTWTDEETGEERSRMGVRYSELLAFIIAAL